MDPVGTGRQGAAAQIHVVVLADGEDRLAGLAVSRDRRDAVVCARGQVDDDPIDIRQSGLETGRRTYGERGRAGSTNEVGQSGRPDQVVGQDRNPRVQSSASARWWKTSREVTTPVGRPSSMIGMWRNPPTAILWIAMAIGSSW